MKFSVSILILLVLILGLTFLNLNVGNAKVSLQDIWTNELAYQLIVDFRLPKTIACILTGIALPISGLLLQELFRNPLADPSVLGITSASGFGVAFLIFMASVWGFSSFFHYPWALSIASFLGAFLGLGIIVFFSAKIQSTAGLIIIGMMIAGFSSALIGMMQFFAPSEKIKTYLMWTFGAFTGLSWSQISVFTLMVLAGLILSLFTLKGISGMRLGESYAHTMGINIKQTRWLILISSAILTAGATAFVGPIAFIGLAIPHICRIIFKKTKVVELYVLVILMGMLSMLLFAWFSQIFPNGSFPINIITSLIGAPIVMSVILKRNQYSI